MRGLGTVINAAAVILGGLLGLGCKRFLRESWQETILKATGFAVVFLGLAGTLSKMLVPAADGKSLTTTGTIPVVVSLAAGALIGELLGIDGWFERLGKWLRHKTGSDGDNRFTAGFLSASLTVSIGAMGILGSIQDGVSGDHAILVAKAVIDLIVVLIMVASLGKGCIFAFIPLALLQGSMTLLAALLSSCVTTPILDALSMVGNILIFCVGINLVWPRTIKVANLLPALPLAVLCAWIV